MIKNCSYCNKQYVAKQSNHKTCSKECSTYFKRKKSCEYDKLHSKGLKGSNRKCDTCCTLFIVKTFNVKFCSTQCKHLNRLIRVSHRYRNDVEFKIKHNLRSRLYKAIKYGRQMGALQLLNCSIDELKVHLESKFQPGMTWDNYGKWHIDHIKPLASFDLTDIEQLKEACKYTNLQPLWAKDNMKKGSNERLD